jgi:5-methylthioadenosine/S-adenosylhomocysteine deaminase
MLKTMSPTPTQDSSRERAKGLIPCDLLIRNGYVVSMDERRRIFPNGTIAIDGRNIVAIGPDREIAAGYVSRSTLDARGGVVHPGFIDAHNHVVHGTCRGIFTSAAASADEPVTFADWKAGVTSADENIATQLAGLEMLRHGFTTVIEPGTAFDPDAIAEGAEAVGIRALLAGCYLWDSLDGMSHLSGLGSAKLYERAPPSLDRCLDQLGNQLGRNDGGRVHGYVAVYGLGTASDELLRAAKAIALQAGVGFHQHEGYIPRATRADRERLGKSRIQHLAELGVLGPGSTLIHLNVLDDDDIQILADSGTTVVWCPLAYLQLGIAAAAPIRMPEMRRRGVAVALGTDGAIDCTIGDAGPMAYMLAQSVQAPITASDVLEMQTIGAARAAWLHDRIGSLEPGKRADIVIRQIDAAESFPAVNPVHQLALNCRAGTVDTVIVDGEVAFRNGRSTRVDEGTVHAEARASVERRLARLGLLPRLEWPVLE